MVTKVTFVHYHCAASVLNHPQLTAANGVKYLDLKCETFVWIPSQIGEFSLTKVAKK